MILIFSAFSLASCASDQTDIQGYLMDEIESSIDLPPGAKPLGNYARYYTEYDGLVHGAYTIEVETPRPLEYGCEEARSDGRSMTTTCSSPADAKPGERRWVKFEDYPAVSGEDCTAIQLQYDPRTKRFTYLECAHPDY
ncbi:hypothetical protein WAB17_07295 [Parerythrobacter aurantius]|uniref:hypothetical protein n=1 Tax=Parerythrobacter aurantius TaxID=3127706 RepID=UPI00324F6C91